jgi:hypothetical protein
MRFTRPTRVLIVANQTADSRALIEAVAQRADVGPCSFTLLAPKLPRGLHRIVDPEDHGIVEAEERLATAVPLLSEAAGSEVVGMIGSHEPFAAVQDALNLFGFDEVIVSMLPVRLSRWLRLDLPHKVRSLGVLVTEVISVESEVATHAPAA